MVAFLYLGSVRSISDLLSVLMFGLDNLLMVMIGLKIMLLVNEMLSHFLEAYLGKAWDVGK